MLFSNKCILLLKWEMLGTSPCVASTPLVAGFEKMFSHSAHSRRVPHGILLKSCFAHSGADVHISLLS